MSLVKVNKNSNNNIILESSVSLTDTTEKISNAFDYEFTGKSKTEIHIPDFPTDFQIGLIVGSSGSGKSTLLKLFGEEENIEWDNDYCIADNFESYEDASDRLTAVGLNSIPCWCQPYNTLSNGQKFRADMARRLKSNAVIDEFTSVVNRECAISCSNSIQKYIRRNELKNIVFCSCHFDIIEWLQPDWIYNTDTKELSVGRSARQKSKIVLGVHKCCTKVWEMFKQYHYLSADILKGADCYVVDWGSKIIGFVAVRHMPGRFKDGRTKAVITHRLVIHPDYQGLGIGTKLLNYIADYYTKNGYLFYSRVANIALGTYLDNNEELWEKTKNNHKSRYIAGNVDSDGNLTEAWKKHTKISADKLMKYTKRVCYSHRYCANDDLVFNENIKSNNHKKLF